MSLHPNKTISLSIHCLVWTALLFMPYMIGYFTNSETPPFDFGTFVMPLQMMILFYLNYLLLINVLLFKHRVLTFLFVNMLIIAVITAVMFAVRHSFMAPPTHHHPPFPIPDGIDRLPRPRINFPMIMSIASQMMVVGLSVAIRMTGKWYEARQRVQELERANTQAELSQLKSQLNPHFLFNSLNNIYALIAFNPDQAQLSLHSLCDMLRYQLYEANRETIPLQKEVEFVRSYCELMRLRLQKHVSLDVDLPDEVTRVAIAPLLFVSIVENAFKHGVSQNDMSYISVKIVVEGSVVKCTVRNSYFPKTTNDRSGSGIGLENLRRRLELIYPDAHSFRAEKIGSEFIAQLTINVNL